MLWKKIKSKLGINKIIKARLELIGKLKNEEVIIANLIGPVQVLQKELLNECTIRRNGTDLECKQW